MSATCYIFVVAGQILKRILIPWLRQLFVLFTCWNAAGSKKMPVFKPSLNVAEVCFTEIKMYISRRATVMKDKYVQTKLLVKQEIRQWYRQKLFWAPLLCFSTQVTVLVKTFSSQCWVLSVRQKLTSYSTVSCQSLTPQKDTELLGRAIQLFPDASGILNSE